MKQNVNDGFVAVGPDNLFCRKISVKRKRNLPTILLPLIRLRLETQKAQPAGGGSVFDLGLVFRQTH